MLFKPNTPSFHIAARLCAFMLAGAALALTSCETAPPAKNGQYPQGPQPGQIASPNEKTYSENELVGAISNHLGVTAESAASAIERVFSEKGRPTAYITGQEASAAISVGVRYGKGTLWMKDGSTRAVFWQGPTIGFDLGGDASKVFTLVYGLDDTDYIYQRFPGVDGSAYLIAGMAVNYQRANGIVLAPIRSGVGLRLGAKVGYTSYTRNRSYVPF